jgi:hypothetical protein
VRLPAKGKETVTFDIRFQGNFEDFLRSPVLRSVYFAGKDKVYEQAGEPLRFKDLRPFAIANRASATAPRAAQPPKVDGKLDDAVWQKAPAPTRFVSLGCSGVVAHQTEVRLLYDADHLYMAIRCHEPELSKLVIRAQENSGRVYKDDSVEIYISPENKPDAPTYRITLNADAAADVSLAGDSKWSRAAGREDAAWTLELAIPWAAVGVTTPARGKQVALQVCRTRRTEPVEYGTWSPCVGGYSKSQHFGTVTLGE